MNLGLHTIQFPSNRYGYVGSVPVNLGTPVPATYSDIMAGRYHMVNGKAIVFKFPSFNTETEAIEFAKSHGFECSSPVMPCEKG